MALTKQATRERNISKIIPGVEDKRDLATEVWWTGLLVETRDKYKDKEGKLIKKIPELRPIPNLAKETRFRVTYTHKDGDILDRDDALRAKGFMPLKEAPKKIQEIAKIMEEYHQDQRFVSSTREVYTEDETGDENPNS